MRQDGGKVIDPDCTCRNKSECPLDGKCNFKNIVYQATITPEKDGWAEQTYIGLTSNKFKARLANHKASFKNK